MKYSKFITIILLLMCTLPAFSQTDDKKAIEQVLIKSYIHGLIDAKNFEEARNGIHEDFIIWGHRDTLLIKKTREAWISQRKKRKNLPEVSYTIAFIDITGDAASAKLILKRKNIIATDYVFLYKFNKNWRIVSAIDHVNTINTP